MNARPFLFLVSTCQKGGVDMSSLLVRIDERLLVEADPDKRGELVARQAGYLARIGRFAESRAKIAQLRQVFNDGRSGRVTAFIMIAEGLLLHYEQLGSGAADRIARAQLLGEAMRDREVVALASAWRAHLHFENSKFDLAAKALRMTFQNAESNDHGARVRCAVVLFNAFALCGIRKQSQYWFMNGRDHALKDGDQASIDALLHSRAAFGVAWLRAQICKGVEDAAAMSIVRAEVASARNLQALTRVEAHSTYIDLCDARLQIMEGHFQSAKDLLMLIRNSGPYPGGHFSQGLVELEIAYCDSKSNRLDAALLGFTAMPPSELESLDIDDRLVAAWMLLELAKIDGRFGSVEDFKEQFENLLTEYDVFMEMLRNLFAEFLSK